MVKNILVLCSSNVVNTNDDVLDKNLEYIKNQFQLSKNERDDFLQLFDENMGDEEIKNIIIDIFKTDFQKYVDVLYYFFPEFTGNVLKYGNIEETSELSFDFCNAKKDDKTDYFPYCMENSLKKYSMIWFCGCSLITFLFPNFNNKNEISNIIESLFLHLTEDGIIIFTEDIDEYEYDTIPIKNLISNNMELSNSNTLLFLKLWNKYFTIKKKDNYFYYTKNKKIDINNLQFGGKIKLKYKKSLKNKSINKKHKNKNKNKTKNKNYKK